jgi:hypothetical protein
MEQPEEEQKLNWRQLRPVLPVALVQSAALGFVAGMTTGGLVGWLLWDSFWWGSSFVAIPIALFVLAVLLRLTMSNRPKERNRPTF